MVYVIMINMIKKIKDCDLFMLFVDFYWYYLLLVKIYMYVIIIIFNYMYFLLIENNEKLYKVYL